MFDGDPVLFSRPYTASETMANLSRVLGSDHAHGDGPFTASTSARLSELTGGGRVLLTSSGTDALELAARLLDLGPGDEVIMPTFTFPSAATSVALTGASCVFVDIDPGTGNIDPGQVLSAITDRTRAISVMHYGGVAARMSSIQAIADEHGITVIEDNAHGLGGSYRDRPLGSFGDLAIQSFHDTKNVHSGEGGALIINDLSLVERAEIMREKGTNRSQFLRGQVDKYTWVDLGSSYLMSDITAAVLEAQLQEFEAIQRARHWVWSQYRAHLDQWADENGFTLMTPPRYAHHAAHLFWLLAPHPDIQQRLLSHLRSLGVMATFHYQPLHASPAGQRYGRSHGPLPRADAFAARLVRLPLWPGLSVEQVDRVIRTVTSFGMTQ